MHDRHHHVKELFLRARDVPLDARAAWLDDACGADNVLRDEVESLLAAEEEMPREYLETAAGRELSPGATISHYRITELLGTGGMGEVWLAHDETLDRRVALKFPTADQLRDPAVRRRLLREAQAAAALEHPAVCRVFELDEAEGHTFIALEHVDGETMAARLARGPVPVRQALAWTAQVAAALEEAHGKGIVHRDLKPANVMITASGAIKVMDFGLARALRGGFARDRAVWSSGLSVAGMIVGTPAYMAPEQVRGEAADERSDIWALGCVLYELICGAPAFSDGTAPELIGAILHTEPAPLSQRQPLTPRSLERLVHKCLAKDPRERWQSAHDLRDELRWVAEGSAEASPGTATVSPSRSRTRQARTAAWRRWGIPAAAAAIVVALMVAWRGVEPSTLPAPGTTMQFPLDAPPGQLVALELSPDGRRLAVTTQEELFEPGVPPLALTLWVRRLDRPGWRRLAVLGSAWAVAWTLDSRALLYVVSGELRSFDVDAEASRVLARPKGAVPWPAFDGSILVGGIPSSTLERVSGAGQVVEEWPADPNVQFAVPIASLPDGRFLVAQVGHSADTTGVFLCKPGPRNCRRLLQSATKVSLASKGRIVYGVGGTLFSQRFDATAGRTVGAPEVIVTDVAHLPIGYHAFTEGPDGTIAWRPQIPPGLESSLVWFDRAGRQLGTLGTAGPYRQVELSPDGRRLAIERYAAAGAGIELLNLSQNSFTRIALPASATAVGDMTWSPDGTRLAAAFASDDGPLRLSVIGVDRHSSNVETLATGHDPDRHLQSPEDWSSDGRHIVYVLSHTQPRSEHRDLQPRPALWSSPTRGGEPVQLTPEGAASDQGQLTPDDRWLAYTSDEIGVVEVYVQPFLRDGPRHRISAGGGGQPRWRGDGRELFYLARDGTMMSVTFSSTMKPTAPQPLFTSAISANPVLDKYVVTADGQRFLGLVPVERPAQAQIAVLLNWQHAASR